MIMTARASVPSILFRATERAIEPPLRHADKEDLDLSMTSINAAAIATIAVYGFLVNLRERGGDAMIDFDERTRKHSLGGL
jgi:hypothetical protein